MTDTRTTADVRAAADRVVDDARSAGQEIQTQVLDTVRQSQEFTLGAIRAWSDAVQSITPSLPSLPSTFPALPDNMPKPEEVVANAYDFAGRLLAAQRKFAEDVLRATAPLAAKAESAAQTESSATRKGSSASR
jgi:hypothetical protein